MVAVGVVTSAIPLLVAGRASAPPRHGPSNAVSSRDPAYGLSTAVPPTSCNVSALAVPGGQDVSSATAIDPSGQYILLEAAESNAGFLDSSPPVDTRRTSLWVHGKLRPMDVPGHATDVNASGVVVGSGRTGPWILRNGHVSTLPGVADGNATAINSTNAVAGTRLLSASSTTRPVVWRTPGAEAIDLPVPPDVFSSAASDIDDDGTVVGVIDMGTPNGKASHAHVWFPDATERDLQVPPGSGLINPVAWSIRNGWVAGAADTPAVGEKPPMVVGMRWNLRTGDVRVLPPVSGGAVNRQGWTVGRATEHGMLVTDPGTVQLPDLGPSDAWQNSVNGLSDDGRMIVGQSNSKAALWRCN